MTRPRPDVVAFDANAMLRPKVLHSVDAGAGAAANLAVA